MQRAEEAVRLARLGAVQSFHRRDLAEAAQLALEHGPPIGRLLVGDDVVLRQVEVHERQLPALLGRDDRRRVGRVDRAWAGDDRAARAAATTAPTTAAPADDVADGGLDVA